jgi:hypothetical protein
MPPSSLGLLLAELLKLPFVLIRDLVVRPLLWLNRRRLMHKQLPPAILNRSRAVYAAFTLTFLIELAARLPLLIGHSLGELIADFLRTGSPPAALVALAGGLALALLFLIVGLTRGGRSAPRDPIASLIALVVAGGAAFLLRGEYDLPGQFGAAAQDGNALLHALYVATLSAALVYAWLTAPLFAGQALRRILRHIENRIGRLRPARRRSY